MHAAGIVRFGNAVEVIDLPDPRALAGDEVLVEVRAAGVANWDEFVRTGNWDVGTRPPMAMGVEAAGTVAAVGANVGDWAPGDAVMTHPLPLRDQGAWAPLLIAPGGLLAPKPAAASWAAAAAFAVPALTADQVLDSLDVRAGEAVLVSGGGGVTGALVVALAVLRGCRVVATAGPSSLEHVRALGAQDAIDYHDPDWAAEVRAWAGGGVAAAVNAAPGAAATAIKAVADGGRLATITSDPPAAERGIAVSNFFVRPEGDRLRRLARLLADERLTIPVARSYPLAECAAALAEAVSGHAGGAIVLTV